MVAGLFQSVFALASIRFWPEQASTGATTVDLVYLGLIGVATFFTVLIGCLILGFSIKYRVRSGSLRPQPPKSTTPMELTWIIIPTIIGLGLFVWAAKVFYHNTTPPENARVIYVVGKQWMWKIEHSTGKREINELHVPAGEPIKLVMTSQDVIHSFFIPAFRVKQDVLPNRYTNLWFEATKPGTYHLFCAEYCGADHAVMRGRVVVMKPSDFQQWLAEDTTVEGPAPAFSGSAQARLASRRREPFYRLGCNACHLPGTAVEAPSLAGLFGREVPLRDGGTVLADEEYIRESIMEPNARIVEGYPVPSTMPSFRGQITERDMIQLIEFIKSLESGWPEELKP